MTTRDRIIQGAVSALANGSEDRLRRSLTIDEVAAAAGLARRTVYTHFETIAEVVEAAVDALTGSEREEIDGEEELTRVAGELVGCLQADEWRALRAVFGWSGSPSIPPGLEKRGLRLVDLLADAGRVPHPPLTPVGLAGLLLATVEDAVVAGVGDEQAIESLLVVAGALTVHRTTDHRPEPAQALLDEVTRRRAMVESGGELPALGRAVIETAIEEFDSNGYADTRLEDIARRSGLSIDLVTSLFGRKSDIARRLVSDVAIDVAAAISAGPGTDEPVEVLAECLRWLAKSAERHPSLPELLLSPDPTSGRPFGSECLSTVFRACLDTTMDLGRAELSLLWLVDRDPQSLEETARLAVKDGG